MKTFFRILLIATFAATSVAFGQNIIVEPATGGSLFLFTPGVPDADTAMEIKPTRNIHFYTDTAATSGGRVIINAEQIAMTSGDMDMECTAGVYPRLAVKGNVRISGDIAVGGIMTCSSDRRFKKNIQVLPNPLANVLQLQAVTYQWRTDEFPNRSFSEGTQIGLIAQDVEALFPDLVITDGSGYKSVNYVGLVPVLIEALKAQQAQIEGLQQQLQTAETAQAARLETLEARLNALMENQSQPARTESVQGRR